MSFFSDFGLPTRPTQKKTRRPQGVSRRQRNRQFTFETLEDRRVMAADLPLAALHGSIASDVAMQTASYSSSSSQGQLSILQNEIFWQSLIAASSSTPNEYASRAIPTDPLLGLQWHLINSGQSVGGPGGIQPIFGVPGEDINVAPVWNQGIFGNGVLVGVFDSGVQTAHPDLAANIHPSLAYNALTTGTFAEPFQGSAHGTAVAGIIGAVANNGIGGVGVAPGVSLVPMLGGGVPGMNPERVANAFTFAFENGLDIVNHSWGPSDAIRSLGGMSPLETQALRNSIIFGRDGLGVIHVWAAGNGASANFNAGFTQGVWDTAAYDGYVGSRYTIGVTGIDHDGMFGNIDGTMTTYPEVSTAVFVAAPTGSVFYSIGEDAGLGSGIVTTDITGEGGINTDTTGYSDLADWDYTSRFNGTSASAPVASGVIALMLEANPNLSWRDVQEILVRSARQAGKFEVPQTVGLGQTQNTWIINQMPVFHDPDPFDPLINPSWLTQNPTLDPTLTSLLNGIHYAPSPITLTNSAGYTISQGVGPAGENIGFAHGAIDAELAVQLAQQWHTKNQALPGELTFTTSVFPNSGVFFNIPAAEKGIQAGGFQLVPGGIGGSLGGGFISWWNEYFADDPDFSDLDDARGGFLEFTVPDNNAMTIESVEVKLSVSGNSSAFMDHARVLLVSPNGTHSELNQFWVEPNTPFSLQNFSPATISNPALSSQGPEGSFVWTFNSNRNWGERSDDAIVYNPVTGQPFEFAPGLPVTQGWRLYIENYSSSNAFQLDGMELVWHGSPIQPDTYRVQGLIGVDDNQDDQFNFSRVIQQVGNLDDNPNSIRYGDVVNIIDLTHESMAANVTVVARRASDGEIVDRFVTGNDGNYYFDLIPDDYIITVEDPLGRIPKDDSLTPAGFLKEYQAEWTISADFFKVWQRDAGLNVPLDANGVPLSFSGTAIPDHVRNINFLLDTGPPVDPEVVFSGTVIADFNGDGILNGPDIAVPGIQVYADMNRNGQRDPGEPFVITDANGEYSLTVPMELASSVINVGVTAPPDWVFSDPTQGFTALFTRPGDEFTGVDFALTPPLGTGSGDGSSQAGYLFGSVYQDINGDGVRGPGDPGIPGVEVFVDVNNSGAWEAGEPITTTNANGAFVFNNIPPGTHRVRVVATPPLEPINPGPGAARVVNLAGGGTVSQIEFGVGNTAQWDFGDLPAQYGITLLSENGARHGKSAYFLGTSWFGRLDGTHSPGANAHASDDGITVQSFNPDTGLWVNGIIPGAQGRVIAVASRHGGRLQGWVDFNGDFDFNDPGERIITDALLTQGQNFVFFAIPGQVEADRIFARFRYGEAGINSVTGPALIGEVEDYELFFVAGFEPGVQIINGPDFNHDGVVDGFDFLAWQRGAGISQGATAAHGDANGDGKVNSADLAIWQDEFGLGGTMALATVTTGDGEVDGSDFLAWQQNYDSEASGGLAAWESEFGEASSSDGDLAALAGMSTESYELATFTTSDTIAFEATAVKSVVALGGGTTVAKAEAPSREVVAESSETASRANVFFRRDSLKTPAVRLESQAIDEAFDASLAVGKLAQRVELNATRLEAAQDLLAFRRPRAWQFEPVLSETDGEGDAFEAALGLEIDWRHV